MVLYTGAFFKTITVQFYNKKRFERILTAETSDIALAVYMAKGGTTGISTTCSCIALLWCTLKILKKSMPQ